MRPLAQLFVCTNARRPDDPLRSGCGAAGPVVFQSLKKRVLGAGLGARVWVTSTGCQGQCPAHGCAVVLQPRDEHLVEVSEGDVDALLQRALTPRATPPAGDPVR